MLIRRFFAFVISAFLIFFPAYTYANTSVGGWSAVDVITAGATNTINAVKGAGATGMRSAVAVAPSVVKVGKHLIKGGGAAALLLAVPQILGEGIDWVLDPANNAIKYTVPINPDASTAQYLWSSGGVNFATANLACANELKLFKDAFSGYSKSTVTTNITGERSANCVIHKYYDNGQYLGDNTYQIGSVPNPAYNPEAPTTEEKYLPIADVAAQVISNAEAGHAPSQEAVKATALEGFAAGEHDAALEAAATEVGSDAGTENPPDTENPPKDPDAPAEPFDPSSIIAAINSLKAVLAGMLSSMTGFFDWVQAPVPPDDQEKKDVPFATTGDVGLDDVDRFEQRIDFTGQCPVNDFSFTMMGVTYAKPIPYHHLCGLLEQIAPWLLAMCYLGTAYFVVENF